MTNFVVFNELSLPLSDHDWRPQLKSYIDVVNQLQDEGITTVRIQQHFADLPLFTETQRLAEFFGGLPRDMQTRLKSLLFNQTHTFQSPLIAQEECEQQLELTINSEYHFDGEVNTGGLACAHIYNTLAISFLTEDKWAQFEIQLIKSHVELDEEDVTVEHLSQPEHCLLHKEALDALINPPATAQVLLQFCSISNEKYPYQVQFTQQAQDQLIQHNEELIIRIYLLIKSIKKTPSEGIGKPELLKENLSGFASRRITQQHRLVYKQLADNLIEVSRCSGHY
jgi:Txe/YoeB family toxin of toxin-antitoxin system